MGPVGPAVTKKTQQTAKLGGKLGDTKVRVGSIDNFPEEQDMF